MKYQERWGITILAAAGMSSHDLRMQIRTHKSELPQTIAGWSVSVSMATKAELIEYIFDDKEVPCRVCVKKAATATPPAPVMPPAVSAPPALNPQPVSAPPPAPASAPPPPPAPAPVTPKLVPTAEMKKTSAALHKFFSEFHFTPQRRMQNAMANFKTADEVREYVVNYFRLTNNSYAADVAEKCKSDEFLELAQKHADMHPSRELNTRLEIMFGPAGSGKTTRAIAEHPGAEVVACHARVEPDMLFRDFEFDDNGGKSATSKAVFKGTAIADAMEQGKTVILDEINTLPFDTLRVLQTITAGNTEVNAVGRHFSIKPGFKIIGTMNLEIGDEVFGLPPPLADRAARIDEVVATPEECADAYC